MKLDVKKHKIKTFAALLTVSLIVMGCAFLINSVNVLQVNADGEEVAYVKAGETAVFTFDGELTDLSGSDEMFIVAFLVPRSWNAGQNATVTFREDVYEPEVDHPMTLIPDTEQPANYKGMSWSTALKSRFGVRNNVLNDMEWVAFESENYSDVSSHFNFTVTIRCTAGTNNLRFKPSFFINHSTDGIGDDSAHWAIADSDECFEVVEGNGSVTDFCYSHYYQIEPLSALQDDFVTFTFQGDVYSNDLIDADNVYLEATAYTLTGKSYTVDARNSSTLMTREKKLPRYSITIWLGGFFGIPEGETISYIEYIFTDKDGNVTITGSDDDRDNGGEEIEEGAKDPFVFELQCE